VRGVLVRRVQMEDVDVSALVVPVGDGGSTAHASPPRDVLGVAQRRTTGAACRRQCGSYQPSRFVYCACGSEVSTVGTA